MQTGNDFRPVLIRMRFSVVVQDPLLPLQLDGLRILLYPVEVSFMPLISRRLTCLLGRLHTIISHGFESFEGQRCFLFACKL